MTDGVTTPEQSKENALANLKRLGETAEPSAEAVQAQADQDADIESQRAELVTSKNEQEKWADLLSDALKPGFDLLAPNWNVQEQEVVALADAWGAVCFKHFGSVDIIGPEIMAVMMTVAVVAPRRKLPAKVKVESTSEEAASE